MKELIIYTGPIEQGKSTTLFEWAKSEDVAGVFCLWHNELKHVLFWPVEKWIPFQIENTGKEDRVIEVGRYKFYENAFKEADEFLRKTALEPHEYLIVDEAGKFELKGEGLDKTLRWLLKSKYTKFEKLILMIRDTLVADIMDHYQIKRARIVSSPYEIEI